jgi:putative ABC transport system ATP-binding protein
MSRSTTPAAFGDGAVVVCDRLVRIHRAGSIEVQALQGLDLVVQHGEVMAIVGASGSGKSTLLRVLSGVDVPTAGSARVAGRDLLAMSAGDRLRFRRHVVGFVQQQTAQNLLPYLSAAENVELPMTLAGVPRKERRARSAELLDSLGIGGKARRRPVELSGGEQQRVAIGVALANRPEVLFADEPTGELDAATGAEVLEALVAANREFGTTVVIVTHDPGVSGVVGRTVAIRDGRTSTEVVRTTATDASGEVRTTAEEYVLLDRAGRLQLPAAHRRALGLEGRVRVALEDDHVAIRPGAEEEAR